MAFELVDAVIERGPRRASDFLVMIALAKRTRKDTCWPSIETIARDARLSIRAVRKSLKQLAIEGWIDIERGGAGQRSTNLYSINREKLGLGTSARVNEMHPSAPNRLSSITSRVNEVHPNAPARVHDVPFRVHEVPVKGARGAPESITESERICNPPPPPFFTSARARVEPVSEEVLRIIIAEGLGNTGTEATEMETEANAIEAGCWAALGLSLEEQIEIIRDQIKWRGPPETLELSAFTDLMREVADAQAAARHGHRE